MSAFTFTSMRSALPSRVAMPARSQHRTSAVLPSYTGMKMSHSITIPATVATEGNLDGPQNGGKVFAMRHGVRKARLGRPADQRKALTRSLVTEVLRHGKITTTKPRAKAIRKWVDKMITLAKNGSLHSRRQALAFVYDKELVANLFEQVPARYADRNGGYCRVKPEIQRRRGDNAEMATIELV